MYYKRPAWKRRSPVISLPSHQTWVSDADIGSGADSDGTPGPEDLSSVGTFTEAVTSITVTNADDFAGADNENVVASDVSQPDITAALPGPAWRLFYQPWRPKPAILLPGNPVINPPTETAAGDESTPQVGVNDAQGYP